MDAKNVQNNVESLGQAEAALNRLGAANSALCEIIDTYLARTKEEETDDEKEAKRRMNERLWATSYEAPETNPDGPRIPQGGIENDGTRVVMGTHENMEGSMYIYDKANNEVRFRWMGSAGQHIYLNGGNDFAFGSKEGGARMGRIGGDDVVGMDADGVKKITMGARKAHLEEHLIYSTQLAERRGTKKKIARLLASFAGVKDALPTPPSEPASITLPHKQVTETANTMADHMEKAAAVLMKEIRAIEEEIRPTGKNDIAASEN